MNQLKHFFLFLLLLLLPNQLGKHFLTPEAVVLGRSIDYLLPTLYLTDLLFGITLTLHLLRGARHFKRFWQFSLPAVFFCSLFLLANPTQNTLYFSARLLELILFAWLLIDLKLKPKQILSPIALSVIWTVFLQTAQFLSQRSMSGTLYYLGERTFTTSSSGIAQLVINGRLLLRPYATFPHPNTLAGYLTILLPFWLDKDSKNNSKSFNYFIFLKRTALILTTIGLFLSFSRTAWVVSLLILLLHFSLKSARNTKILGLVIVFAIAIASEELVFGRFLSLTNIDTTSVSERWTLSKASWDMWKQSPWVGAGLGEFIRKLPGFLSPPYILQPVHSLYLLIFSETGSIGSLIFIFLGAFAFKKLRRKNSLALSESFLALLLLGFFDHYLWTQPQTKFLFALILALIFM